MRKTIKELLLLTGQRLKSTLEARIILQHQLKMTYEELLLNSDKKISEDDAKAIKNYVERRLQKEPIAHIIGFKEFYGLEFKVTSDTLIPRPDSETLINAVLSSYDKDFEGKITDFGTGSGCLIITLLKHLPNAKGIALDTSEKALKVAEENAQKHDVLDRVELLNVSWNNLSLDMKYDIIISNPPYIETDVIETLQKDVQKFEPVSALDGGVDGLDCYKEIFDISKRILSPSGKLFVEIGYNQEEKLKDLAQKKGLVVAKTYQDLSNIVRCVKLEQHSL